MGDGKISVLLNQKTLEVPVCSLAGSRLVANCLERWSNPIWRSDTVELNQGLTDWWQHWLVGGIGACLMLFIACYRYENLIQWHWIIYGITFP